MDRLHLALDGAAHGCTPAFSAHASLAHRRSSRSPWFRAPAFARRSQVHPRRATSASRRLRLRSALLGRRRARRVDVLCRRRRAAHRLRPGAGDAQRLAAPSSCFRSTVIRACARGAGGSAPPSAQPDEGRDGRVPGRRRDGHGLRVTPVALLDTARAAVTPEGICAGRSRGTTGRSSSSSGSTTPRCRCRT